MYQFDFWWIYSWRNRSLQPEYTWGFHDPYRHGVVYGMVCLATKSLKGIKIDAFHHENKEPGMAIVNEYL